MAPRSDELIRWRIPGGEEVVIREYDTHKDLKRVEQLERRCEVGPSGKVSLFTDLMGDPICRIRHSPAYVMFVAEQGEQGQMVGLVRGCIKTVVCGRSFPKDGSSPVPAYAKVGYILGLRVSPAHRRLGIGLKLVETVERWLKQNGAEYAYMATEKENEASIRLFTEKRSFSKFRTPAILVHPVHAHAKRKPPGVKIVKLEARQAEDLYRRCMGTRDFFPADMEAVLKNPLSLGTWLAFEEQEGATGFAASWAVLSVWKSDEVFKMEVKGVSTVKRMYAAATRFLDKTFPWLKIPSIPNVFRPFGIHFLYGLHAEGPKGGCLMTHLWWFSHNLARQRRCRLIATEVGSCDPLKECIPHWECFSCPEDLWCVKNLAPQDGRPDWAKSPPGLRIFVDPRDF